jgi:cyclic pyranopterin monophosphate synthase
MGKGTEMTRMVDVSEKPATTREAVAEGFVALSSAAWSLARRGKVPKGNVLEVARVAGILAAKATPRLLPLCHPVPLSSVRVDLTLPARGKIRVEAQVKAVAATGVEMEALTAVAAAALCVYDMLKPFDRSIAIGGIRLLRKTGGESGDYEATGRETPRRSRSASRSASRRSSRVSSGTPKRSR